MKLLLLSVGTLILTSATFAAEPVVFDARTAHSGNWSDAETWEKGRSPKAGDFVQIRGEHTVTYDVHSSAALRMVHVAGTLTFSRVKSTLLDVGLLKIEPGEITTEDGFNPAPLTRVIRTQVIRMRATRMRLPLRRRSKSARFRHPFRPT